MKIIIGLDIGTSKICALALDIDNNKSIAIKSAVNDSDIIGLLPDWHEQNPVQIRDICFTLIAELLKDIDKKSIIGIGISGQMHGVMLVNEKLEPQTNFITWRDQRTLTETKGSLKAALAKLEPNLAERTGCRLSAGYGGATLYWLQANNKLADNAKAVTIADYIAACLTGTIATEPTHAASWGIFNVKDGKWDGEAIKALDIRAEVLPPLSATAKPLAKVNHKLLPNTVQVCSPIGDNQASVIGAIGGFSLDTAVVNLGTGGQISIPCEKYAFSNQLETRPLPFLGYIQVGASLCGGWSYAYLCRFFQDVIAEISGRKINADEVYSKMNQLAERIPFGANGLMADTRFSGTRIDPKIRGSFTAIDRENLTAGNLTRAVMEGIVTELKEFGENANLKDIKNIIASGNAIRRNPIMLDIISSIFATPCQIGVFAEEAALGAAIATATGLGY